MSGTREMHLLHGAIDRPRIHALLPVRVVAVLDQERDGAAERAAMADAAPDDRAVGLDLHPAAAAVAELAPREVAVDVGGLELEPRGQPLEHGHEPGTVRFAGSSEAKRHPA